MRNDPHHQARSSKKNKSLKDFWNLEAIDPAGVIHHSRGRSSIVFEVEGIDPLFYSTSDWENISSAWRPLLRLNSDEELQIIFSKTCDYEKLIEAKLEELNLTKNESARKLLLKRINQLLSEVDPKNPHFFSSKIIWVFSKTFDAKDSHENRSELILQRRSEFEQLLSERRLSARPLTGRQIQALILSRANGSSYVSSSEALDDWPEVDILPTEVVVNKERVRSLHLQTLPEQFSQMGMMLALTTIPATFDLTLRFAGKDPKELYNRLDRKRRVLFGILSRRKAGDIEADARYQELNQILSRLNQSNDSLLSFGMTLSVRAPEEFDYLQRWALNQFVNAQSRLGFLELKEPYLGVFDSYLESIPTFKGFEICNQTLLSSNAVHFLPLFQTAKGADRPIANYRTLDGQIFSLNPASSGLANYNWLVSGTSGSGKSFFVNSLLLQSQSLNPRIFIIDVGGSYNKLTRFLGGNSLNFDTRAEFSLSPFFLPKAKDPIEESKRREHIQLVFWEMLRDETKLPTIEEKAVLKEVLMPYFEADLLPKRPVTQIRDQLKARGAERLALLLDRWCAPSFYGNYLDSSNVVSFDSPIMTFDLKGLNDFSDLSRVVQLILCSSLWAVLRADARRFSFVVLDEVAFTLLKAQPAFVDELISTVRKYNAAVVVITQDLEKVTSNPAGASILQNTQMKAILQQRGDPKHFAEPLELNDAELEAIRRLQRKRGSFSDIFLIVDDRKSLIRYTPNLSEYLLATTVPDENRNLELKMSKKDGNYSERFLAVVEDLTT